MNKYTIEFETSLDAHEFHVALQDSLHHLEGLKWIAPKAEVLTDKHAFSEFAQTVNTNLKNIIK